MKRLIVILFPLLLMILGCSTFRSSKRLDLSPFANYTVDLAADIEFGMTNGTRVHYLMEYRSDPVVQAHSEEWNQVRRLVRGIVSYSVEVTTLGSSQLREKERNARFSLFLDRLVRPVIQENPSVIHISEAGLDSILAGIRTQKSFLGALGEA